MEFKQHTKLEWLWKCNINIGIQAGGRGGGVAAPQLLKLLNFSGKTLMIQESTLQRKYYSNAVGVIFKTDK